MPLSVLDCGATGDGETDDTIALQRAIDEATDEVLFPAHTYRYDASVGLRIPGHRSLIAYGATFDPCARPSYPTRCRGVETIPGSVGVRILGGVFNGSRARPTSGSGMEWSIGLRVDGATDVIIDGAEFNDFWTDGVWVGGNEASERVTLRNVKCARNRRNGLAVVNASRMLVYESEFTNTVGTDPKAGVDLEGNPGDVIQDVTLLSCKFAGNEKGLYIQKGRGDRNERIKVIDCGFVDNTAYHLIAAGVDGVVILGNGFVGGKFGASIGAGTRGLTFADNVLHGMPRPCVLAGAIHAKIYGNRLPPGASIEQLPAGGLPGASGDVVILTNG